jgi:hypothetical protein
MNNDRFNLQGSGDMTQLQPAETFKAANEAWTRKDFATVRAACASLLASSVPAPVQSYAHLRIAQSYLAEHRLPDAKIEYERIRLNVSYPAAHRDEAEVSIGEIERQLQGLPARDPLATRTPVAAAQPGAEFFVAPGGSDTNSGTAAQPFATLARARDAVRALKGDGLPAGGVAVTLKPGTYALSETFALGAEDSGTSQSPVIYRAEAKGTAVLYGGTRISGFTRVTDPAILERLPAEARGQVFECRLKEQGINNYGELKVRGIGQPPSPPTLELYFNGKPMTLARWPNEGFVGINKLIEPGVRGSKPSVFVYDSDRHARWTHAEDAWLFGYFRWLWADGTAKIGAIDTAAKTLTTAEAYDYGGGMDTGQGIIYYAFNLLEEIDQPGEWYLDRTQGVLYFWPPADPAQATIEINLLSAPMVVLEHAAHVRLEGLVLDLARDSGIVAQDSEDCLIAACTVRRCAGNGITITGGRRCGVLGCDVSIIGRRAIEVIGGNRETLTPARHFVENCQIHDFGRIDRTYTPAIQLEGVGNRVAHNLMYDCPSSVMRIEGNDHVIEYNEIHSSVRESDDQGGMDLFYNPTYRGVVFRYNHFHHNGKTGSEGAVHGQAAIRLDDAISGVLIYGNVFFRSSNGNFGAIQINSGRDNVIDNNIFADCKQGVSGGWVQGNEAWRRIREGRAPENFYRTALYLQRYPQIAHMMDEPGINHIWRNVFYRCGKLITRNPELFDLLENGVFADDNPGFVDAAAGDFRLLPDAALFQTVGFKPIPVDEIGLYADAYRATWPVHTTPVALPDWRQSL